MKTINKQLKIEDKVLCDQVHFTVSEGEHIALIGYNGVGKSTLLYQLEDEYDAVILEQEKTSDDIVLDYILSVRPDIYEVKQRIADDYEAIGEYIELNGYELENTIMTYIKKFGMEGSLAERAMNTLSGGERTKVAIIRLLISGKEWFLFDEPTNHIDQETKMWLIDWMKEARQTVVFASHDRAFINQTATKIVEMTNDATHTYQMNYDDYATEKNRQERENAALLQKENKEKQKMRRMIQEMKEWHHDASAKASVRDPGEQKKVAKLAKRYKTKEHQLEQKLSGFTAHRDKKPRTEYDLKHSAFRGKYLAQAENISLNFGEKRLFSEVSFQIKPGDKIALTGKNGCGKTSLLKLLLNELKPNTGSLQLNPNVKMGYFSQHLENLNYQNTVLKEVQSLNIASDSEVRTILASFRFGSDRMDDRVAHLSMGEKCRLSFIKLYFSEANLLLLDEPTNYFDLEMQGLIESMLQKFEGAILFITHDPYFCEAVSTKEWRIEQQTLKDLNLVGEKTMNEELLHSFQNLDDILE
ncbi:ribosomal protection-like ABC-F family protein [Macrococcus brunensis]|uniref:ribosomal protection-like ABC-F family protein n=1 Tax=Macrococcus brunensis TaxID=198483 RepID=UPI001EF0C721|nr:ABC-F family ATP-binding cassette domain-containing protein [Macrococcus brunensis]ULG72871.1 ATP-binding cassette domain-containing protein [Macrococcus brunensis]